MTRLFPTRCEGHVKLSGILLCDADTRVIYVIVHVTRVEPVGYVLVFHKRSKTYIN